jgi:hypothetical protein
MLLALLLLVPWGIAMSLERGKGGIEGSTNDRFSFCKCDIVK